MRNLILFSFIFIVTCLFGQEKILKLQYAKTEIRIPSNCTAKSEYEIFNCNGFSAQWLFLNDEMVKQKVNEQLFLQLEQQLEYKSKKPIFFLSQNQKFNGTTYTMKDGTARIIAFGKVNEVPLILNLSFNKEPKNNNQITEFGKNFIILE